MERMDEPMTKWTKEPPREAGWWWCRVVETGYLFIVHAELRDDGLLWQEDNEDGEPEQEPIYKWSHPLEHLWWPIPIPTPKEDQ